MKNSVSISIFILLLFITTATFAQQGTISGILTDSEGQPLPGVSIIIKGSVIGTQTDFDGNYSINCSIGDILVFSYVGFGKKEVTVTREMFEGDADSLVKNKPVQKISSTAYTQAIKNNHVPLIDTPSIEDANTTYNKNGYNLDAHRIRKIELKDKNIHLSYFKPDIYYEIGGTSTTGFQFVKDNNLPELQKTYSQGRPSNSQNTFFGPETNELFSYGPRMSNLEFDGSQYPYDQNGRLVPLGSGNGDPSKVYENDIFRTSIKTTNSLFFNASTDMDFYGINYMNKSREDIFGKETSHQNKLSLRYKNNGNSYKSIQWDTSVEYQKSVDNQPNINGFQNNLLLNTWVTPISFDNKQQTVLANGGQRSFSPGQYNNPIWLLENNQNRIENASLVGSVQNKFTISHEAYIKTIFNYKNRALKENFAVTSGTAGFLGGYQSRKNIDNNDFDANLVFRFEKYYDQSKLEIYSLNSYSYEGLVYDFSEEDFGSIDPENLNIRKQRLHRNTYRFLTKGSYTISDASTTVTIANNALVSSIQNNKWFLPTLQIKTDIGDFFDFHWLRRFSVTATTSYDVNDSQLFYNNPSHNSLLISPSESLRYSANNDLFVSKDLLLEEKQNYEVSADLNFELFYGDVFVELGFNYFNNRTDKSVFPVFENNRFQLQNVANVNNKGVEFSFNTTIESYNHFSYAPGIVFSTYRTKVTDILSESDRIPIAGFSTISKNLIEGYPAGILVGSVYQRDDQNNLVIDDQGFPLVAPELAIVGDPIPDYNLGFSNTFRWNKLKFNFLLDFQKGGDVWNGTQNVLNHLGTSQFSAEQREITDFIFEGVNSQGDHNTIAVDFANPGNGIEGNRFVRYGFEGVSEDAIVDGSYVNLKSINLTYSFKKNERDQFFRTLEVSLYANNLFTWTKYRGASPYSSLFDQNSSHGLQFFNTPITSEVGININIKI